MRPPSSRSSSRSSGHRRIADFLAEEHDSGDESYGGGMLPVFLADRGDLVEVMLEVDEDSMLVRSVTPTATAAFSSAPSSLSRSSSTASRIRRKFAWLMSPTPADQDREEQARLARTRSGAQRALKGLRFISRAAEQWYRVEERFAALAHDGLLARDDFGECIGMAVESREFAVGVFDALARRRRQRLERISKEELYDFWLQISDHSFDARLQIFFDMVDTNADGRITREEVQELIVLSASANKLSKLKEQAAEYAALIMEELDPQNRGYIELWQLGELLLQRDSYMSYSRALSTTSGLSQNLGAAGGGERRGGPSSFSGPSRRLLASARKRLTDSIIYFNWRRAWVLAVWACAMVGLFTWKFVQYRRWLAAFEVMGYCLPAAKGAAETLKLNMALVLLPVCRNTLTWLRSTRIRRLLPLDDNITFHKTIAAAIVVGVAVHAGTHLGCDFPRLARAPAAESASLLGWRDAPYTYGRLVGGVEGMTGMAMVGLMGGAFALASGVVRSRLPAAMERLRGFNAFWYSHHLLALVYVLLLVHGYFIFLVHRWYHKTTWMYVAVPLLLYLGERTLRTFRSKAYAVKILKVSLLPGSVLSLIMSKPHGFRCKSGQYIFLQCPAISTFEWHPFSLTSAPGDDHLSVHIRTTGDWTQELKQIFTEHYLTSAMTLRGKLNDLVLEEQKQKTLPRLLVDGPYGAPAQDYRNYDVLLLVGLGIGATPFISILKDLLYNIRMAEELMDSATETSRSDESMNSFISLSASSTISKRRSSHRTRNAHFYWVTREAGSFEWFKGVMDEVAEMDKKGIIEMHNYLTSVYEERDARTTLLTMVQALSHAKHGVDIVSGTRVRTHFARPNWNEVFARIASKHQGATVGVFYCGTPVLSKELKRLSHELSHKTSTRFHFHKEFF